jgi:hypothetical protein
MPRNSAMWLFFLAVALVSGLVLFCSPKPVDTVMSYQEAYNSHDVEKLLALVGDDIHYEMEEQFSLQGKEKMRGLAEYDFALNTRLSISQLEASGDTVRGEMVEVNDWLKTADIPEARYTGLFVVKDGLIRSVHVQPDAGTRGTLKRLHAFLIDWGKAERPDKLTELMPDGQFLHNAENAERALSFLRDWKQNVRRQALRPNWQKLGE